MIGCRFVFVRGGSIPRLQNDDVRRPRISTFGKVFLAQPLCDICGRKAHTIRSLYGCRFKVNTFRAHPFQHGVTSMKTKSLFRSGIMDGRRAWTIPFLVLLGSFFADFLPAQAPPSEPSAPPPSEIAPQQLSPEELKGLLAPIALYPDALVALILPASTVPSDLVLAARYIASNGDPAQVANQPWDESVKSLGTLS